MNSLAYCGYCHSENLGIADKMVAYRSVTGWDKDADGQWRALSEPNAGIAWYRSEPQSIDPHKLQYLIVTGQHYAFGCGDCGTTLCEKNILRGVEAKKLSEDVQRWAGMHLPKRFRVLARVAHMNGWHGIYNDDPVYRVASMQWNISVPRFINNHLVLYAEEMSFCGSSLTRVGWVAPSLKAPPRMSTAFLVSVDSAFVVGTTPERAVANAIAFTRSLLRKQPRATLVRRISRVRARL